MKKQGGSTEWVVGSHWVVAPICGLRAPSPPNTTHQKRKGAVMSCCEVAHWSAGGRASQLLHLPSAVVRHLEFLQSPFWDVHFGICQHPQNSCISELPKVSHEVQVVIICLMASEKWNFYHAKNELLTKTAVTKGSDCGMGGKLLQELFRENALEFCGCQLRESFLSWIC